MTAKRYDFSKKGQVMGVLNVTPDSFSDGGQHLGTQDAIAHGRKMMQDGVDIIDIGGQSTRPGYEEVPPAEEIKRILPVIKALRSETDLPISVDTYFPEVAAEALANGADIINDVKGLDMDGMLGVTAKHADCGIVIMHSRQRRTELSVIEDIQQFYHEVYQRCMAKNIQPDRLCFDPGIGFGKTPEENLQIMSQVQNFRYQQFPLLYGSSRKRSIARLTGEKDPLKRDYGSVAAALFAVHSGAEIVRVHEVYGMKQALDVWRALADDKAQAEQ